MNIGLVNHWYPPEAAAGGVATYNTALTQALTRLGHRAVVISSTHSKRPRSETVDGIPVIRLPFPHFSWRLNHLPIMGRHMRALRTLLYARTVAEALPAIVDANKLDILEYADIEAESFFHCGRVPLPNVVRMHGPLYVLEPFYRGQEQPFATSLIKRMERTATGRADAWTAPSRFIAQKVASTLSLPDDRVHIIPNLYSADPCDWELPMRTDPVVLFVGRLESLKGADTLAEAIPLVLARRPGICFVYVAWDRPRPDGSSMKEFLTHRLEAAGALGSVEFLTSTADKCTYARIKPDLCVVPSRFETFSYPVFEAMVHGLPVIGSRTAAIPELIKDGESGLLFEAGNAEALAEAILELAANPERRRTMGNAGQARARRDFDPLVLAGQVVDVYERTRRTSAGQS